jgi:hypothetical protein
MGHFEFSPCKIAMVQWSIIHCKWALSTNFCLLPGQTRCDSFLAQHGNVGHSKPAKIQNSHIGAQYLFEDEQIQAT